MDLKGSRERRGIYGFAVSREVLCFNSEESQTSLYSEDPEGERDLRTGEQRWPVG